ncbi:MAG: hypothetical protein JW751_22205 [Polyangiaceae bacterium]|nr:hypothetical protein [Polyangiaceae bacterium]
MSLTFFWIPAADPGPAQDELNRFLSGRRVLAIERHFVAGGGMDFEGVSSAPAGASNAPEGSLLARWRCS